MDGGAPLQDLLWISNLQPYGRPAHPWDFIAIDDRSVPLLPPGSFSLCVVFALRVSIRTSHPGSTWIFPSSAAFSILGGHLGITSIRRYDWLSFFHPMHPSLATPSVCFLDTWPSGLWSPVICPSDLGACAMAYHIHIRPVTPDAGRMVSAFKPAI